jgi:hypothetical protein
MRTFDPGARHVQRGRDRVRCQLERKEKFFPQGYSGATIGRSG